MEKGGHQVMRQVKEEQRMPSSSWLILAGALLSTLLIVIVAAIGNAVPSVHDGSPAAVVLWILMAVVPLPLLVSAAVGGLAWGKARQGLLAPLVALAAGWVAVACGWYVVVLAYVEAGWGGIALLGCILIGGAAAILALIALVVALSTPRGRG